MSRVLCCLLSIYTGSRLRRTLDYNEQYYSQKGKLGIDINGGKCSVATSTVYNEQIFMRYIFRCKRDTMFVIFVVVIVVRKFVHNENTGNFRLGGGGAGIGKNVWGREI